EAPRTVTPRPRGWQLGEEVPDRGKDPHVGRRVGARTATDGGLVDDDDLVEVLEALDGVVGSGLVLAPVEMAEEGAAQNVVDQSGLAAAGHAGHTDEPSQGDTQVDAPQVVLARAPHHQGPPLVAGHEARRGYLDALPPGQIG